jgi:hypothetical protein
VLGVLTTLIAFLVDTHGSSWPGALIPRGSRPNGRVGTLGPVAAFRPDSAEQRTPGDLGPGPNHDPAANGAGAEPDIAGTLRLAADRSGEIVAAIREMLAAFDSTLLAQPERAHTRQAIRVLQLLAERTRQLHTDAQELAGRVSAARGDLDLPSPHAFAEPEAEPDPESEPEEVEGPSEGVRTLIRMMVSVGHTPLEIEQRLREELGIADAEAIVQQVLGTEGEPRAGS